ncbi:S9 family peptidase [Paenibacillus rigui]|uniref:Peptidase S9 family protein n=1 Tax=Paenibacillus rigui TaxID=554312 RepID=A0A229UQ77_9BACL|nr:S9 family peptidase [Paenibacillus rigui]OXM85431.1 peptidase S9 family protein [Paenibacillus rigui]
MQKRYVAVEDLYSYQWVSDPSVCPQTGAIAYVHKTIDQEKNTYRTNVRLVALDGSSDRPFTYGDKDELPAWSPAGSELAFLRTTDQGKQLWLIPLNGGEARQLTHVKRGIGSFVWSPDGKRIAFTTRVSEGAVDGAEAALENNGKAHDRGQVIDRTTPKAEGSGWWDGLYSHLYVLELASGQIRQVTSGNFDVALPFWSPDGSRLSFLAKKVDVPSLDPDLLTFSDIYRIRSDGGGLEKLTDSTLSISQAGYSPDGQTIVLIGNDRIYGSATQNRIYTVPASGGKPVCVNEPQELQLGNFALSDMKAAAASTALWFTAAGDVYLLGSLRGNVQIGRFSMDGTYKEITRGDREFYQLTMTSDGRYLVAAASDPARPGDLYRIDTHTGEELRLTSGNDELLESLEVSVPESFWFEASDGRSVQGWLMKPVGMVPGEKYPMLLNIHGGPHALYANSYSHEFQTMASQGYVVLYLNPRGSFGYGQDFVKACRGDFGGRDYHDLMDAVDHVAGTCGFVDETRLGVTGGSYGGFMTNWIVGHTDRFRAAVTDRSISNWLSFYGMSDIGISYTEGEIEGNPWEDADKLWKHSPLAYAAHIHTPLLILHGEHDLRCPIEQAEQLYVALKRLGKRTQLVRFPGSNHALPRSGKPSLRVERLNRIMRWFQEHIES